jgi:hypothetical protein
MLNGSNESGRKSGGGANNECFFLEKKERGGLKIDKIWCQHQVF